MAWVVDTCLLIDVLEDDPRFGLSSAVALEAHAAFASRFQGLLTRNPSDFSTVFPALALPPVGRVEEQSKG